MPKPNLEFAPVSTVNGNWGDLEKLFESKGGPHYCWCMLWRKPSSQLYPTPKESKKYSLKEQVDKVSPIGILAYVRDEPIGWCSIAPRESYKPLHGDEVKENVWSIVCFFIKRPFRNVGITSLLINHACKYACDNGAKYVEAYPVDKDSPSYRFMGITSTFENAGFQFVKKAGKRRNVMILKLEQDSFQTMPVQARQAT